MTGSDVNRNPEVIECVRETIMCAETITVSNSSSFFLLYSLLNNREPKFIPLQILFQIISLLLQCSNLQ